LTIKKVPIPFNINSLYEVFPSSLASKLEKKLIARFGYNVKVPILKLNEAKDEDLRYLANYIYEKVFLNYTIKQWGIKPEELDPSVTGRVPVYISRDNTYFQDPFQGMPKHGYTKLFEALLKHPKIGSFIRNIKGNLRSTITSSLQADWQNINTTIWTLLLQKH
jgi:UDP-galactopyranose mutase